MDEKLIIDERNGQQEKGNFQFKPKIFLYVCHEFFLFNTPKNRLESQGVSIDKTTLMLHIIYMAKKQVKAKKSAESFWHTYKQYIVPSLIGGVIAWIFSEDLRLGVMVGITVWIGSWIGMYLRRK